MMKWWICCKRALEKFLDYPCKKYCNLEIKQCSVNLSIPCNIFYLSIHVWTALMWTKLVPFEPKAKNTFPSFRTQRSINLLLKLYPYSRSNCLYLYDMMMMILCMSKWMFMNAMYDVMYRANECPNTHIRSHIHNLHSLRNDWSLFAAYFSASPLIFRCISADFSL